MASNFMRAPILTALENGAKTPTQIAEIVGCHVHTVYRNLRALQELGLVKENFRRLGGSGRSPSDWELVPQAPTA